MILVPLITIELQLLDDCKTLGLNAIAGSQVNTWSFPPTPRRVFSQILKLCLTSKEGFRGRFWGRDGSTSSSYCLQCRVSLFKEGGQMLHRHSQITWAALSGQGRDPCFVALTQRAAANSLYQRQRNVSQPCFTSCCIQFQEFGLNLQLPVVVRNGIVCLNAAVLPWQIWNCVARNTKWLLVVNQDYSYQYYEKCVLKCSSIAVTNLKLCGEKYEMTPGRKSMCWIGRNPFGQTGGARVDKLGVQLNQL